MDSERLNRYAELSQLLLGYRQEGLGSEDKRVKDAAYEMANLLRNMSAEERLMLEHGEKERHRIDVANLDPSTFKIAGIQVVIEGFFVRDDENGDTERITVPGELAAKVRDTMHDLLKRTLDQMSEMSINEILGYDDPRLPQDASIKIFCGMSSGMLATEEDAKMAIRGKQGGD